MNDLNYDQDKTFKYSRHGGGDFLSRLNPLRYLRAYFENDLHDGMFDYTK